MSDLPERRIEMGVKLLYKTGGRLTSFCAPMCGVITYPIQKWVGPKSFCGPLTVFDTIEHARMFLRFCFANTGKQPLRFASLFHCEFVRSQYQSLWVGSSGKVYGVPFPTGTQFADKIQLLEEIHD